MNTTTAEKIEIMQAAEDGKAIEYHMHGQEPVRGEWTPFRTGPDARWNWLGCNYRIAREKPRELWAVRCHSGMEVDYYPDVPPAAYSRDAELVHYREVTEDEDLALDLLEGLAALYAPGSKIAEPARRLLRKLGRLS